MRMLEREERERRRQERKWGGREEGKEGVEAKRFKRKGRERLRISVENAMYFNRKR